MDNYLVDVPVSLTIWTRSDCQIKQFEIIKMAKPSTIFLFSDGGRNDDEWKKINYNRRYIIENIKWKCNVYKIFLDNNVGMYSLGKIIHETVWNNVDKCIFLEDDDIPSVSYFKFCAELLDRYQYDERIECICGFNHIEIYDDCPFDYFFSRQGSIWGYATWKRVWLERRQLIGSMSAYELKLLKNNIKYNKQIYNRIEAYNKQEYYEGHIALDEFWIDYHIYSQNRLQIIPKCNLISNIGVGEDTVHFKKLQKPLKNIMNMKTYELSFPLKHPNFVIADEKYEVKRNKALGTSRPLIKKIIDHILIGDYDFIKTKIKLLFNSNIKIEN